MGAVEREINLRQYSYHGLILPDKDPKNQGRYKVHIPELHPLIKTDKGIWCKNNSHDWRFTSSDDYFYGQYWPIQPGTKVLIRFYENDFNSGYIEHIVSDMIEKENPRISVKKGVPGPPSTKDRDDTYVVYKTPKKHNLFLVLENCSDSEAGMNKELIPNSIHMYYNYRRTTLIINEDGIHWFTMDNRGVTVENDNNEWINRDEHVFIQGHRDFYINDREKRYIKDFHYTYCDNEIRTHSALQNSTTSGTKITEDAPTIWMNSGKSKKATKARWNKGEDEVIKQNKIDQRIMAHLDPEQQEDSAYVKDDHKSKKVPEPNDIWGGQPFEGHPKKENCKISKGLDDRCSTLGASQVGAGIRGYPEYGPGGKGFDACAGKSSNCAGCSGTGKSCAGCGGGCGCSADSASCCGQDGLSALNSDSAESQINSPETAESSLCNGSNLSNCSGSDLSTGVSSCGSSGCSSAVSYLDGNQLATAAGKMDGQTHDKFADLLTPYAAGEYTDKLIGVDSMANITSSKSAESISSLSDKMAPPQFENIIADSLAKSYQDDFFGKLNDDALNQVSMIDSSYRDDMWEQLSGGSLDAMAEISSANTATAMLTSSSKSSMYSGISKMSDDKIEIMLNKLSDSEYNSFRSDCITDSNCPDNLKSILSDMGTR